ncbi:Hot1p KNAG_0F01810 [Huiozyma naganishii CBS 8797]|uniref:Transcription activator GCR1-like domain-containing protein n=1 Tax=Huiozyma naganishii (strain ATCC MYA-139 / BCRC 22969 / CBS 8797 / KCTC 17520 / NBRC 10181 / NCYC 3082 / Yp74L-3) TaxID=1071383 RepID=J7S796_HUIN7|nr:hypothetical protein KNAG_0F01810 [Kazachstania naganishii CBS 8797]CCK70849.1 hypothetical protein KNAG_0F01810 [Kazachstania naganishii CBS 8797]
MPETEMTLQFSNVNHNTPSAINRAVPQRVDSSNSSNSPHGVTGNQNVGGPNGGDIQEQHTSAVLDSPSISAAVGIGVGRDSPGINTSVSSSNNHHTPPGTVPPAAGSTGAPQVSKHTVPPGSLSPGRIRTSQSLTNVRQPAVTPSLSMSSALDSSSNHLRIFQRMDELSARLITMEEQFLALSKKIESQNGLLQDLKENTSQSIKAQNEMTNTSRQWNQQSQFFADMLYSFTNVSNKYFKNINSTGISIPHNNHSVDTHTQGYTPNGYNNMDTQPSSTATTVESHINSTTPFVLDPNGIKRRRRDLREDSVQTSTLESFNLGLVDPFLFPHAGQPDSGSFPSTDTNPKTPNGRPQMLKTKISRVARNDEDGYQEDDDNDGDDDSDRSLDSPDNMTALDDEEDEADDVESTLGYPTRTIHEPRRKPANMGKLPRSQISSDSRAKIPNWSLDVQSELNYKILKAPNNVRTIWDEYVYGINGNPSIRGLEEKYGSLWRRTKNRKTFGRRKRLYKFILNGIDAGKTADQMIKTLEDRRLYRNEKGDLKRRTIGWLQQSLTGI